MRKHKKSRKRLISQSFGVLPIKALDPRCHCFDLRTHSIGGAPGGRWTRGQTLVGPPWYSTGESPRLYQMPYGDIYPEPINWTIREMVVALEKKLDPKKSAAKQDVLLLQRDTSFMLLRRWYTIYYNVLNSPKTRLVWYSKIKVKCSLKGRGLVQKGRIFGRDDWANARNQGIVR